MRRLCAAMLVVAALVFYAGPVAAEEAPADEVSASLADVDVADFLPSFPFPLDDGGTCTGVPDTLPGIFDFTEACAAHDACYADPSQSRLACDLAFRADLVAACESQHPDVFDPRRFACLAFADLYFVGVRIFGGSFRP